MTAPARFIAVLDVGHGNCCVVKDDRGVIVIDTGLGSGLLEFLKEVGIRSIDVVLLSHADQDHISGLIYLLASNEVRIERVRLNTDAAKHTQLWKNLVYELELQESQGKLNWEVQLTADSQEDYSVGKLTIDVVAPGKALAALGPGGKTGDDKAITTNSISCVVHLSDNGRGIAVFPGDIDEVGLNDLVRRRNGQKLKASILIYPHHGGLSGTGGSTEFAKQVCDLFEPSTVIFSIGRGKHGTPRPDVVRAVREKVQNVRIACTQLSEHCSRTIPQNNPAHLLPIYADGRQDRVCCAGTMLLNLDSSEVLLPVVASHSQFVAQYAGDALCQRPLN